MDENLHAIQNQKIKRLVITLKCQEIVENDTITKITKTESKYVKQESTDMSKSQSQKCRAFNF